MPTTNKEKNVLIVEFNEFNVALLQEAVKVESLPAIERVLNMRSSHYKTNDRYNSGYLEPWVQWVSIHTGSPSSTHLIKHLGDVPDLQQKQCWEVLGDAGISTGIWGVMNGSRNQHEQVKFFVPDPWTFSEAAHPDTLNPLLHLPRYVAKNYQNLKKSPLIKHTLSLLNVVRKHKKLGVCFKEINHLRKGLKKHGKKPFLHICFFEYLAAHLFCVQKQKTDPKVSILFLNTLAHLQHHQWYQGSDTPTPEILYGLKVLDRAFALLFDTFKNDTFIFHNALSQMNTNHEKPWILYRQHDPKGFLNAMQLNPTRVEQHMTHDGHVFFKDATERDRAFEQLTTAKMNGHALFHVEKNVFDDTKLFYHLVFTDEVPNDITFTFADQSYRFYDYFDRVVKRTGRHLPLGTIFCDDIVFPDHIFNHQFNQYLYHYLDPERFPLQTPEIRTFNGPLTESLTEVEPCDL